MMMTTTTIWLLAFEPYEVQNRLEQVNPHGRELKGVEASRFLI